jgi:hypothetical protein
MSSLSLPAIRAGRGVTGGVADKWIGDPMCRTLPPSVATSIAMPRARLCGSSNASATELIAAN